MTESNTDSEQSLISHLIELRTCVLRSVICVIIILLLLLPFANEIYNFIATQLIKQLPENSSMIATEITSTFFAPLKITICAAIFISIPYLSFQTWSFVSPGLYKNEKKIALPILLSSIILFYFGVSFAYYVIFPIIFSFFVFTGPETVQILPDINQSLNLMLKLLFAFGMSFEIPIATFLLIRSNFISAEKLAANRPYIILAAFFAGMLLTPPDVISQILLAVPIWLLFESGLLLGRLYGSKKEILQEEK
jgi:sec-independent protein translocase protein TatC